MASILFLVETIQYKQYRCIYLKNQKVFSEFLCAVFKSTLNFNYLQTKMTRMAYVFPKLRTTIDVVNWMSKKSSLRWPLDRQHGKWAETLI